MSVKSVKYALNIPGIDENDFQPTQPNSKWGILTCHWPKIINEDQVENFKKRNIPVKEVHSPEGITWVADCTAKFVFNRATKKTYCDDDKSLIGTKFTLLIPGSLLLGLAKTICHIFPVVIAYEINELMEKAEKEEKKLSTAVLTKKVIIIIAKNFADIVLTPLYAVALSIVALVSLLLSPINTDFLYDGRVVYGELVISLLWGQKSQVFFTPCMMPINDLSEKGKNEKKRYYENEDTFYQGQSQGSAIRGVTNTARKYIMGFKRKDINHPTYQLV